jgi:hypothetical protein
VCRDIAEKSAEIADAALEKHALIVLLSRESTALAVPRAHVVCAIMTTCTSSDFGPWNRNNGPFSPRIACQTLGVERAKPVLRMKKPRVPIDHIHFMIQGGPAMGNRYERSRMARPFSYKGVQYHPGLLVVLAVQLLCLSGFAFSPDSLDHNKWLSGAIAFSLLFGLILSLGFLGTWNQFRDDVSLWAFLNTNPVESAVAIAATGEVLAILAKPLG